MVHEFGHWTNFAHTVVNGQIYLGSVGGDNTRPDAVRHLRRRRRIRSPTSSRRCTRSTTARRSAPASLEADDIAIASRMYPEPNYASTTGSISGADPARHARRFTGVNVIARNVADPFHDAVSAISRDFTDGTAPVRPQRRRLPDHRSDTGRRLRASTSTRSSRAASRPRWPRRCRAPKSSTTAPTSRATRTPTTRRSTRRSRSPRAARTPASTSSSTSRARAIPCRSATTARCSWPCRSPSASAARTSTRCSSTPTAT